LHLLLPELHHCCDALIIYLFGGIGKKSSKLPGGILGRGILGLTYNVASPNLLATRKEFFTPDLLQGFEKGND